MSKDQRYNDPNYLRGRAEELRSSADGFSDATSRERMMQLARDYDTLALRAQERELESLRRANNAK